MRARNIKPSIFKNEYLADLGSDAFRAFTGLWCLSDREGRLEDRPSRIEAELFPFKFQKMHMEKMLEALASTPEPFIIRYGKDGKKYIQIINFLKHQQPHYKEAPSIIPPPDNHTDSLYIGGGVAESIRLKVIQEEGKCKLCGKKTELTLDHIIPRSFGGGNDRQNLQCLCRKCNSSKNNRMLAHGRSDVGSIKSPNDPLIPDSPSLTSDSTTLSTEVDPSVPLALPEPKKEGPTPEDLLTLWNSNAHPNLPRAEILTDKRKRHILARLAEHPSRDFWEDLLNRVNRSSLLRGETGTWKCTFDWILNVNNMAKILEGNYEPIRRRGSQN